MLKLIKILTLSLTFCSLNLVTLLAKEKTKENTLELSGNVTVLAGFQEDSKNGQGQFTTPMNFSDYADSYGRGLGMLGEFRGHTYSKKTSFNFYVDQIELDISKSFGENIRLRADLDFGQASSGSLIGNINLEQAYVTANIPIAHGIELLVGRFNAPIGLESVDRYENTAISNSNLFRFLRSHNLTGAKFYYDFSEHFDWQLYVVNNLFDSISPLTGGSDTAIPSFGTRLGFSWGEKNKENNIGLSYAAGPEGIVAYPSVNQKKHWSHIADLDFNFHLTNQFSLSGEAIYRQDNRGGACPSIASAEVAGGDVVGPLTSTSLENATRNCKAWAAQLMLSYAFNENWNAWLRYEYLHDIHGNYTQSDQQIHASTLGVAYHLTESANIKSEYRLDTNNVAGPTKRGYNHGFALQFSYNF